MTPPRQLKCSVPFAISDPDISAVTQQERNHCFEPPLNGYIEGRIPVKVIRKIDGRTVLDQHR